MLKALTFHKSAKCYVGAIRRIGGYLYACTYLRVFTTNRSCASDHHTPLYPSVTAMETDS